MMTKDLLEDYLLKNIPISSSMGIKVDSVSLEKVILSAPISNNINHKKTVFGGSLHAVLTLASFSLLDLKLKELFPDDVQIVIAKSEVKYLKPVGSDFYAESFLPSSLEWNYFIKTLQKRKKARIKISAQIFHEKKLAVDYCGVFVAIKN